MHARPDKYGALIAHMIINRQKDNAAGEVPVAFVVPSIDSELTEDAVKDFIAKQVCCNLSHL